MVDKQKIQTFKTDTHSKYYPTLHLDWLVASQVIDEVGYFEQEKVLRENQDQLAEIDSRHLGVTNKIAFRETKLLRLPINSAEYIKTQKELAELEAQLLLIEEEKKEAVAILQKKVDAVAIPTIIERTYNLVGLKTEYELAIVDEPPQHYPNKNVFSIYKRSEFTTTEYIGRKQASLNKNSEEFKANEFKGWKIIQNHYEITHIYAGLLTTKYTWIPDIRLRSNLNINPISNPDAFIFFGLLKETSERHEKFIELLKQKPDAYKFVDIVGMKLITENYNDENRSGQLELINSYSSNYKSDSVMINITNQDQLLVVPEGSNVDFTFLNAQREPKDKLLFNQRNPLYQRIIQIEATNTLAFSEDAETIDVVDFETLREASRRNISYFNNALNTKAVLNVYGKYWSIDKLDLKEVYDYGYRYYNSSSLTPPGVTINYNFTPREYSIKVNPS